MPTAASPVDACRPTSLSNVPLFVTRSNSPVLERAPDHVELHGAGDRKVRGAAHLGAVVHARVRAHVAARSASVRVAAARVAGAEHAGSVGRRGRRVAGWIGRLFGLVRDRVRARVVRVRQERPAAARPAGGAEREEGGRPAHGRVIAVPLQHARLIQPGWPGQTTIRHSGKRAPATRPTCAEETLVEPASGAWHHPMCDAPAAVLAAVLVTPRRGARRSSSATRRSVGYVASSTSCPNSRST